MADPISVTLGIIPVVAGFIKVTKDLSQIVKTMSNAPKQIKAHINEISMTRQVMLAAHRAVSDLKESDLPPKNLKLGNALFKHAWKIAVKYKEILDDLDYLREAKWIARILERFQWYLKEKELQCLHNDLRSTMWNLSIFLHAVNIQMLNSKLLSGVESNDEAERLKVEISTLKDQLKEERNLALVAMETQKQLLQQLQVPLAQNESLKISALAMSVAKRQSQPTPINRESSMRRPVSRRDSSPPSSPSSPGFQSASGTNMNQRRPDPRPSAASTVTIETAFPNRRAGPESPPRPSFARQREGQHKFPPLPTGPHSDGPVAPSPPKRSGVKPKQKEHGDPTPRTSPRETPLRPQHNLMAQDIDENGHWIFNGPPTQSIPPHHPSLASQKDNSGVEWECDEDTEGDEDGGDHQ